MAFGERMRREREMRGIALEEIANATKIGTRSLRALEEEDFDKLPGGIFNKGFVRAYARYLGIDEEQAVADYVAAFGEAEERADAFDSEHLKKIEEHWKAAQTGGTDFHFQVPWGTLFFLLILAGAAFAGWHYRHPAIAWLKYHVQAQQHAPAQEPPPPPVTPAPAEPAVAPNASASPLPQGDAAPPATTGGSTPSAATASPTAATATPSGSAPAAASVPKPDTTPKPASDAAPKPLQATQSSEVAVPAAGTLALKIHARQQAWVQIKVDGALFQQGELIPGRNVIVTAKKSIYLKTGNAGGLDLSFNGQPVPALGQEREVKSVTFGPNGVQ